MFNKHRQEVYAILLLFVYILSSTTVSRILSKFIDIYCFSVLCMIRVILNRRCMFERSALLLRMPRRKLIRSPYALHAFERRDAKLMHRRLQKLLHRAVIFLLAVTVATHTAATIVSVSLGRTRQRVAVFSRLKSN